MKELRKRVGSFLDAEVDEFSKANGAMPPAASKHTAVPIDGWASRFDMESSRLDDVFTFSEILIAVRAEALERMIAQWMRCHAAMHAGPWLEANGNDVNAMDRFLREEADVDISSCAAEFAEKYPVFTRSEAHIALEEFLETLG